MIMMLLKVEPTEDGTAAISVGLEEIEEGDHELEQFYNLLDCDTIDIVTDVIGGVEFDLIVDDNGMLARKPLSYYINDDYILVGSILFCHHDGEGKTIGLTKDDLPILTAHLVDNVDKLNDFFDRLKKKWDKQEPHAKETKEKYKNGMRIELIEMDDIQAPPAGTVGIVSYVDNAGTLHVRWENGSMLGLVPGKDKFRILD